MESSADPEPQPHVVEDCRGALQLLSDGTVVCSGAPLVNPFGTYSPCLDSADVGRMLVVATEGDLLRDKNVEYAEGLKAMGKDVELVVFAGEEHAFFGVKPLSAATGELVRVIRRFIATGAAESG